MDKRVLALYFLGPLAWMFGFHVFNLAEFLGGFGVGRHYFPGDLPIQVGCGLAAVALGQLTSFLLFRLYDGIRADVMGDVAGMKGAPQERCTKCGQPIDAYDVACRHCGRFTRL